MTVFRVEAQITSDELLRAARQLPAAELESFVAQVLALQAQRKSPSLSRQEAELLIQINQGLPDGLRQRLGELIEKRQAETLTPAEHDELLHLTSQVEEMEAQRAAALGELARLRRVSLNILMQNLGIHPPQYA